MNDAPIGWSVSRRAVDYPAALAAMEARAAAIAEGSGEELVWLLEHPALYTAGVTAKETDLLEPGRFPVYRTDRGGQYTYHGPGLPPGTDTKVIVEYITAWVEKNRPS